MSRKDYLSIIGEDLEGERSSDIDVITARAALQDNKVKTERSKKVRRGKGSKGKGSKGKGSKGKGSKGKDRSRKKLSRRQKQKQRQKKTKMEELQELEQLDAALMMGQDHSVQESMDWIRKAYEDKREKEYLQSVEPKQPLAEDPIQMILKYAMSDNEPTQFQSELERLSQKKEGAQKLIHDFDLSKYNRGKVLQYEGEIDPYLIDDNLVGLLPKFFFKNIEALTDIYNKLHENEDQPYIQDQSQLMEIPENIYEKLLKPFLPYFVSSPYYYGTKDVRPPYNETDVLAYEKLSKNWEELLENAYGDEGPPILEPLTPDELNISPELLESVDSDEKSELKKYYLKVRDAYVLLDRIDNEYEKLLQEKENYYSTASIKDCLEIQKLKLDQVSKNINLSGNFADVHLSLCTDNKALTEIYIRNFEKLPTQLIMPDATSYVAGLDSNTSSFLNLMRDVANDPRLSIYIPQCVFSSVFKYLRGRRFFTEIYGARVQDRTIYATPCNLSFLIAQSFKRMDPNETTYVPVSDMYLTPLQVGEFDRNYTIQINDGGGLSGIEHLRRMLQQIEDDCPERINIQGFEGFDVEKSKRFIILMLMGLVNAHHYKENLIFLEQMWGEKMMKASSQLEAHEKKLSDKLGKYEEAVNRNTLLEGEWILSLIDDLKKLYNYFNNKLEHYEVKYGDDYDDYFRPYYPPTR